MAAKVFLQLTPEARALQERFKDAPLECTNAMKAAMDLENVLTVSHIQQKYLSFGSAGPVSPIGLRVQSGSLRRSVRASKAVSNAAGRIESTIGGNVTHKGVNYLGVHELGATIPPHTITARGSCLAFMVGGKQVFAKSVKHPGATLPAKHMIQNGIADRLPAYVKALSGAVVATLGGKK